MQPFFGYLPISEYGLRRSPQFLWRLEVEDSEGWGFGQIRDCRRGINGFTRKPFVCVGCGNSQSRRQQVIPGHTGRYLHCLAPQTQFFNVLTEDDLHFDAPILIFSVLLTERHSAMINPPHPGDLIKTEIVGALGLSVTKAADILKVRRATLSDLLHAVRT